MRSEHFAMTRHDVVGQCQNFLTTFSQLRHIFSSRVVIFAFEPPEVTDCDSAWILSRYIGDICNDKRRVFASMARRVHNFDIRRNSVAVTAIQPLVARIDRGIVVNSGTKKKPHIAGVVRVMVSYKNCVNIVRLQAMRLKSINNGLWIMRHPRVNKDIMAIILHECYSTLHRLTTISDIAFYENVHFCHVPSIPGTHRERGLEPNLTDRESLQKEKLHILWNLSIWNNLYQILVHLKTDVLNL